MQMQQQELELRREAQQMEFELRRLALDRADENEKAANQRLENADQVRLDFARRGQTFAMWLAGASTAALLAGGLVCVFLTVAGVIPSSMGLTAAGILLAAGLFTGIANLIKNFLPGNSGESGDKSGLSS
jgi:multidrug efflux pump subunit AcrA (membrane-fusion protein)